MPLYEKKMISDMDDDTILKEACFSTIKNTYNIANHLHGDGYQHIMQGLELLKSSYLACICAAMEGETDLLKDAQNNVQTILEKSYILCDKLVSSAKERVKYA